MTGTTILCTPQQHRTIETLAGAWKRGQGIVPLVGAGISVEAGIPSISQLITYLAKVRYYIKEKRFVPVSHANPPRDSIAEKLLQRYSVQTAYYLRDYGWPDSSQLTAELWQWFTEIGEGTDPTVLTTAVQAQKLDSYSPVEEAFVRDVKEVKETDPNRFMLRGDWKNLLGDLTAGNPEYSETLFQHLVSGCQPGLSHLYLTFLSLLMNWRVILTINFDNLIETSFRNQGSQTTVYEITTDALPPHASLVTRQRSLVKLHGGAFGLRIGEPLNYPLDHESRARILGYLPPDPILLVMGCGGWDRRVMDLVEAVLQPRNMSNETAVRVVWIHYEAEPPTPVQQLVKKYASGILTTHAQWPGAFLQELYSRVTGTHPVSRTPYVAVSHRPVGLSCQSDVPGETGKCSVYVFDNSEREISENRLPCLSTLRMEAFVAKHTSTHVPVWVDMATIDTVGGLVSAILRACRRHDRTLPFAILPTGLTTEDELCNGPQFTKALRLVRTAFSRGSYVLALDGVDQFGRPPTVHHGVPGGAGPSTLSNFKAFCQFIYSLIDEREHLRDSMICLSTDVPTFRFGGPSDSMREELTRFLSTLRKKAGTGVEGLTHVQLCSPQPGIDEIERSKYQITEDLFSAQCEKNDFELLPGLPAPASWSLLFILSAFRRPRSIVALRRLLIPTFFPGGESGATVLNAQLELLLGQSILYPIEGGFYWMDQRIRNDVYESFTADTRTDDIKVLLEQMRDSEESMARVQRTFVRLLCMGIYNYLIATYYYTDMFLSSRDSVSFFEQLYHQMTAARSLTKASAIARKCEAKKLRIADPGHPAEITRYWPDTFQGVLRPSGPTETGINFENLEHWRNLVIAGLVSTTRRHRDYLLSQLDGDSLLRCLSWIEHDDLQRLNVNYYDPQARGKWQDAVADTLTAFRREVQDLKATLFRDRTEVEACTTLRLEQISGVLSELKYRRMPDVLRCPTFNQLSRYVEEISKPRFATWIGNRNPGDSDKVRQILMWLIDVAACVKMRSTSTAQKILCVVGQLTTRIEQTDQNDDSSVTADNWLPQVIRKHAFRSADNCLTLLNPWYLMGAKLREQGGQLTMPAEEAQNAAAVAIAGCEQGLASLQESQLSTSEKYVRYRCQFQSVRGRALSFQHRFKDAYQTLETAIAGLHPAEGQDKVAIAVATMYLAEAILLRSDRAIGDFCNRGLNLLHGSEDCDVATTRNHLDNLSPEGKYALIYPLIYPQIQRRRGEISGISGLVELNDIYVQALHWKVFSACNEDGAREEQAYEQCRRALTLPRSERSEGATDRLGAVHLDHLETWEQEWTRETIRNLIRDQISSSSAQARSNEPLIVGKMLDQSLVHWSEHLLRRIDRCPSQSDAWALLARKTDRRLEQAADLLDRAEILLAEARRNAFWWQFFYRLRAQLQVERILSMISFGSLTAGADSDDPEEREIGRPGTSRLRSGFVRMIRDGLQYVRNGLDHILVESPLLDQEPAREHRLAEEWFLQLWVKLFCVGYVYTIIRNRREEREDSPSDEPLTCWKAWSWYNHSVGLARFLHSEGQWQECMIRFRAKDDLTCSLRARAFALTCAQECMRLGAVRWLRNRPDS